MQNTVHSSTVGLVRHSDMKGPPLTEAQRKHLEEELTAVELQLGEAQHRMGTTIRVLQLLGRVELMRSQVVSSRTEVAISDYKLALLLEPANPDLKLEMGIALALQSKKDNRALGYESAFENMLQAEKSSKRAEPAFDLACVFSAFPMPLQAERQWSLALQREDSRDWLSEGKERQAAIESILAQRTNLMRAVSTSPGNFLSVTHYQENSLELALRTATVDWLPKARSAQTLAALHRLSILLASFRGDAWLKDMLAAQQRSSDDDALACKIHENEDAEALFCYKHGDESVFER